MWSHLILACTILLVMSSCGGSKSVPAAEDQQAQAVKQGGLTASRAHPLRTQAEKGNVEAQFALAQAYDRGRDLPQDKTEAVRWYQLAAKQGDAFSQFYLGNKYWEGAGVSKNEKEAVRWWYSAAAQGFAPAQNSLGLALATGGAAGHDSGLPVADTIGRPGRSGSRATAHRALEAAKASSTYEGKEVDQGVEADKAKDLRQQKLALK